VAVVLVAADLVGRLGAQLDDVKGIKTNLGVREALRGADGLLIAGRHVGRLRRP